MRLAIAMELSAAQVGNSKINSYIEEEVKIVLFGCRCNFISDVKNGVTTIIVACFDNLSNVYQNVIIIANNYNDRIMKSE